MITYICLFWIGKILQAPTWYFALIFVGLFIKVLAFGFSLGDKNK